jgi:hypothetical protein
MLVNLPVTNVPRYLGRNSKTLGLQHLQFLGLDASQGFPDLACVVHHTTDELLAEQHAVLGGQATPPVNTLKPKLVQIIFKDSVRTS